MIKGVNKRIVEVTFPESAYFEKAVVFLRADSIPAGNAKLTAEAKSSIAALEQEISHTSLPVRRAGIWAGIIIRSAARISVIICAAYAVIQFLM